MKMNAIKVNKWLRENRRRFQTGMMDEEEIAVAAFIAGYEAANQELIGLAFDRHCHEHFNADFEVCSDPTCKLAVGLEKANEFCPGHAAPIVNGYCFDCGLPRK